MRGRRRRWPRRIRGTIQVGQDNPRATVAKATEDRAEAVPLLVTGIVSTGDAEDNAMLVPLSVAQELSGHPGQFRQLFVSALTKPADALADARARAADDDSATPTEYDRWFCSPYISSISYQIKQVLARHRCPHYSPCR